MFFFRLNRESDAAWEQILDVKDVLEILLESSVIGFPQNKKEEKNEEELQDLFEGTKHFRLCKIKDRYRCHHFKSTANFCYIFGLLLCLLAIGA